MKRQLWGEFTENSDEAKMARQIEIDREIMIEKRGELKILHSSVFFEPKETHIKLHSKNPAVNQIVGLKQKQEMIQELIETSETDQFGFQQLIPTLRETLESIPSKIPTPKLNEKFNKLTKSPLEATDFTAGKPKEVQKVNKKCVDLALKKSICGLTRLTDYTEISDSALTLFTDAVNHFFKSLMEAIVTILDNEHETETDVSLMTFERAYFALTGQSITSFFNYQRDLHDKHRQTVRNFTEKVSELKTIVECQQLNEIQPDFYQNFFVKEEIKQEFDDFEN